MPIEGGDRGDNKGTIAVTDKHARYRRILIVTDNEVSANLLGYAFEANAYDVLATSIIHEAIRFATTCDPGAILLMLSSLAANCDAARRLRSQISSKIIAFSTMPVTAAERNLALQSGCDDYRNAFLRIDKLG